MSTKQAQISTNAEIESQKVIAETSSNTLLYILIGIIVIFVIIGIIFFVIKPYVQSRSPASYQLEYQPFAFWSAAAKTEDTDRNVCNLYQFSGTYDRRFEPVNGVYRLIPAQPSVDASIVDQMTPLPTPACYDVDQQILVKAEHTCIKLSSLEEGDFTGQNAQGEKGVSFCTTFEGTRADVGSTEDYYAGGVTYVNSAGQSSTVTCNQLPCLGSIGLVGLGYRVIDYSDYLHPVSIEPVQDSADGISGMRCLTKNADVVSVTTCDGTDQSQIFRILRQQYGVPQPSSTSTRKSGTYGNTAIIVDRATSSTCLNYDNDAGRLVFNNSCNPYNWALYNAITTKEYGSPQQIVYIGNLTDDQKQNLFFQKNPTDIWNTIQEYDLMSLKLVQDSDTPILSPFYIYLQTEKTNEIGLHGGQLVDYTLFNEITFGTTIVPF